MKCLHVHSQEELESKWIILKDIHSHCHFVASLSKQSIPDLGCLYRLSLAVRSCYCFPISQRCCKLYTSMMSFWHITYNEIRCRRRQIILLQFFAVIRQSAIRYKITHIFVVAICTDRTVDCWALRFGEAAHVHDILLCGQWTRCLVVHRANNRSPLSPVYMIQPAVSCKRGFNINRFAVLFFSPRFHLIICMIVKFCHGVPTVVMYTWCSQQIQAHDKMRQRNNARAATLKIDESPACCTHLYGTIIDGRKEK